MTERTIEPTRQSGAVVAANPPLLTPEMTYAEALEYHQKFDWRLLPKRSDRARQALIAEVERLRLEKAELQKICRIENAEARRLIGEVERLEKALVASESACGGHADDLMDAHTDLARVRAALPGIIGCAHGEAATCARDPFGWGICCAIRKRCVAAGLLPAVQKAADQEDGA